jgi:hypothetical protein
MLRYSVARIVIDIEDDPTWTVRLRRTLILQDVGADEFQTRILL